AFHFGKHPSRSAPVCGHAMQLECTCHITKGCRRRDLADEPWDSGRGRGPLSGSFPVLKVYGWLIESFPKLSSAARRDPALMADCRVHRLEASSRFHQN